MSSRLERGLFAYASVLSAPSEMVAGYTHLLKTHFLQDLPTLEEELQRINRDISPMDDLRRRYYRRLEHYRFLFTVQRNRLILDGINQNARADPEIYPQIHGRLARVRRMKATVAFVTKGQVDLHQGWLSANTRRNIILQKMALEVGGDGTEELIE
ncbi:hypothetical protein P167DRAFT_566405 [Morchella conica CCBAS932]|uniref:Uncharacterized protein n=1 Tax=Morchella conica CCBAS932 TaxID=1392247 RepID=A0A3N4KJD5_9PEZI|nr:hypothetical protein P167DRAFT_566405 [Morchella conica CCBAS932]